MKNNQLVKVAIIATAVTLVACLAIVVSFASPRQESDGLDDMRNAAEQLQKADQALEESCKGLRVALEKSRQYRGGVADAELEAAEKETEEKLKNCPNS